MPARKKGAVRKGHGVMCNMCGLNCGKGGALSRHVQGTHEVDYATYKKCFHPKGAEIIADSWDSVVDENGKAVVTHVLVQKFVGDPGARGVPRAARVPKKAGKKVAKKTAKKSG